MKEMDYTLMVERYLDGDLNHDEFKSFEEELRENEKLVEELEFSKMIDEAIKDADVLDLRDQLEEIHWAVDTEEKEQRKIRRTAIYKKWYFPGAASIILIVALGLLYLQGRKLSADKAYEKYFQPYELMVNRSANADDGLMKAQEMYDIGDFAGAAVHFEEYLAKHPTDYESTLYSGIALMELEAFDKADDRFLKILHHNDNLYVEQAEYCLAFCYLKTNREDEAKELLKNIAESESTYNVLAEKIINRLK